MSVLVDSGTYTEKWCKFKILGKEVNKTLKVMFYAVEQQKILKKQKKSFAFADDVTV